MIIKVKNGMGNTVKKKFLLSLMNTRNQVIEFK